MVDELTANNRSKFISYKPQLLQEYDFWMKGSEKLSEIDPTINRVVLVDDNLVMNRYFDEYAKARPESFKEDYELVHENDLNEEKAYRDLRAGAESGWDYSSRWFEDPQKCKVFKPQILFPSI